MRRLTVREGKSLEGVMSKEIHEIPEQCCVHGQHVRLETPRHDKRSRGETPTGKRIVRQSWEECVQPPCGEFEFPQALRRIHRRSSREPSPSTRSQMALNTPSSAGITEWTWRLYTGGCRNGLPMKTNTFTMTPWKRLAEITVYAPQAWDSYH